MQGNWKRRNCSSRFVGMCNQAAPLRNCIFIRENVGEWETERSRESSLSFTLRNTRRKHGPKRKMNGERENTIKTNENQHFAPSRPPRWSLTRAIRGPHGAPKSWGPPWGLLGTAHAHQKAAQEAQFSRNAYKTKQSSKPTSARLPTESNLTHDCRQSNRQA